MSVVPLIPLRRVDDLIDRLKAVKADADARGFGMLAYFVEACLIEARIQQRQLANDKVDAQADPAELWRPET